MSWFSNAFDKVKSVVGTVAKTVLPIAGFAVGLAAPSLGAAIGNLGEKIGGAMSKITGIGDGMPGILGIGDGKPGILGIGTGAAKEKTKQETIAAAIEAMQPLLVKAKTAEGLTQPEQLALAKLQAEADMKSDGVNPLVWIAGGLLALFAL